MKLSWSKQASEDYDYWHENDVKVWKKVKALIKRIQRDPRDGWGQPKKLQRDYEGWLSRRITDRDRLVYRIHHESRAAVLEILQCRDHYADNKKAKPKMHIRAPKKRRKVTMT